MALRFNSNVHQRDSRAALFGNYEARTSSQSPAVGSRPSSGYGYQPNGSAAGASNGAFSAYPGGGAGSVSTFRSATPNSKGQYSDATLAAMESQTDEQMDGMMGKVKLLKDVRNAPGNNGPAENANNWLDHTCNRGRDQGLIKIDRHDERFLR